MIRAEILRVFGYAVSTEQLWGTAYLLDFSRPIQDFLWKSFHDAHRIGAYWNHIPECEARMTCQVCGVTEDLAHILLKCKAPGQNEVWEATRELWRHKHPQWPELTVGTLLGCGLARFQSTRNAAGIQRLYRILISESMFVIWKLRNERVIHRAGAELPLQEILNKWNQAILNRFEIDRVLANRPRHGKRASLDPNRVIETWSAVLVNEDNLPKEWSPNMPT